MIFTVLIPEYLVGKAFSDWLAAKSGVEIMKVCIEEAIAEGIEGIEWEMVHAYMANMGYFVVDFSDEPDSKGKNER